MQPSSSASLSHRQRASTTQATGGLVTLQKSDQAVQAPEGGDVFEAGETGTEHLVDNDEQDSHPMSTIEDLPIEIRSLTERFLEGLQAKVHPAPLTADQLSDMFQDFYDRAAQQIATHIASLASKIGREKTEPAPLGRLSLKGRPRAGSGSKRADSPASASGGEMLTPVEVTDRRKARRALEIRRSGMEETVERCVCEKVYERIWKHRSTEDDARDEKLRSRTAALVVVGIGLKELRMDAEPASLEAGATTEDRETDISASLAPARKALQLMNEEEYPLGKLQHLTAAHKAIVDTLSEYFPSTSSADEILPTLIYTLITTPPENLNVVSNLSFIQRFRAASKIDGEAAYCLVNLEAAVSFLETVDLSSLRADELPEGPPKTPSQPQTPAGEDMAPLSHREPMPEHSPTTTDVSADTATATLIQPIKSASRDGPRRPVHNRSLSSIMQAQATKIEAGRESILGTADRVYESINGTLENSFKFVFGRFKEQVGTDAGPLPKTLDDARRLMSSSMSEAEEEDDEVSNLSGRSSPRWLPGDNKMLDLVSGRRQLRDRSTDSAQSGSSTKRVAFAAGAANSQASGKGVAPVDSLRDAASFITSINPLNRFGVPSFPRFGRSPSGTGPSPSMTRPDTVKATADHTIGSIVAMPATQPRESTEQPSAHGATKALATLRGIKPPRKRFLDVSSAAELRIGDVEELLQEYRRLAKAIGEAIAM